MLLDDSKHKVYIYNLDDELTSSDSEPEDGRVVFLPDIEKALRANRIPPVVKVNSEGYLAGKNLKDMQVVLYNEPSSLTVAPEHDTVRKAIIEARARARARQEGKDKVDTDSIPVLMVPSESPVPLGTQESMSGLSGVQQEGFSEDVDAMDLS